MISDKILFVDDDPKILQGYTRQLGDTFRMETAPGSPEGLKAIGERGPFAVIVSDMRMPVMDGVQFFSRVREQAPDSVRIMLTGNADLQTAINAVNQGNIFRFLTKPCSPENIGAALRAGLEMYRLIHAERELLRDTLTGSVKVLTDIVSLVNPLAFGRASRIRRYVRHIAMQMQLADVWQYELAAMLSQIGCVTLPRDVLERLYGQESLSTEEQRVFASHPATAARLIENIPRLKPIAAMIEHQQEAFWVYSMQGGGAPAGPTQLGAQILKVALDLDQVIRWGLTFEAAWHKLRGRRGEYNPEALEALMGLQVDEAGDDVWKVQLKDLVVGMVACEDIQACDGSILVPKGQEITSAVLVLLRNATAQRGIREPFRVRATATSAKDLPSPPTAAAVPA